MSEAGSGFLEVVVALALTSLLAGAVHTGTHATFAVLRETRLRARALTAARNRLETLRAAWCGAALPEAANCPVEFRCEEDRRVLWGGASPRESVYRLSVRVAQDRNPSDSLASLASLAVAVPAPAACP